MEGSTPAKNTSPNERVHELVRIGVTVARACRDIGISRATYYRWLKTPRDERLENEMGRRSDTAIRPDLTTPLGETESLPEALCGEDRSA